MKHRSRWRRPRRWRTATLVAAASTLGLLNVDTATASETSSAEGEVRSTISGAALDPACQSRRSEMWPQLAADPHDPMHLTASFMSEGMLALASATSTDGGRTWDRSPVAETSRCKPGAPYMHLVNPQLAAGPEGSAYVGSSWLMRPSDEVFRYGTLVHARSAGGSGWSHGTSPGGDDWTHNITVVPDPARAGHAVALWTRIVQVPLTMLTPWFFGPTSELLAASTADGGATFGAPVRVALHPGDAIVNVQGRRTSDGAVLAVYDRFPLADPLEPVHKDDTAWTQTALRSVDGGATWTEPVVLGERHLVWHHDPDGRPWAPEQRGAPVGSFKFDLATGPGGRAAVAWAAPLPTGEMTVRVARSNDDGRSWSAPHDLVVGREIIQPAVAFDRRGEMAVLFYDWSSDVLGDEELSTDVQLARESAGWSVQHLDGPFDLRAAYEEGVTYDGWAIGVYQDLVGLAAGFGAAYTVAAPLAEDGATDVRYVGVPG